MGAVTVAILKILGVRGRVPIIYEPAMFPYSFLVDCSFQERIFLVDAGI